MNKLLNKMLTVLLAVVLLAGCNNNDKAEPSPSPGLGDTALSPEQKIESYLQTLCSAEFAGRAPGTEGGDLAADWLAGKLEEFSINPYNADGYKMGYTGLVNTFIRSEMIITDAQGSRRELIQGKDFFVPLGFGNYSITVNKDDENYKILEAGELGTIKTTNDSPNKFVYFAYDGYFKNSAGTILTDNSGTVRRIQLSEEIYGLLSRGEFVSVEIINEVKYEEKELYNIIGKIGGSNSSRCIVLSAHFDHMGAGGETYFPGALDNASGTSALLYIAEQLKILSESETYDFDIVIAFFNSEEYGMPGSKSFVETVSGDYENVYNINIDCVGLSDGEIYATGKSGNEKLDGDIVNFAAQYGIVCDSEKIEPGDGISFLDKGIPSVYFISSEWSDYAVHSNLDTYDKINCPQIVRMSDMLVDFLSTGADVSYTADIPKSSAADASQLFDASAQGLEEFRELVTRARNGEDVDFYTEFYSKYPEMTQLYFGYSEYQKINERITALESFGDYRLVMINTDIEVGNEFLIYVNKSNRRILTISKNTGTADEELTLIEGLESDGYYYITSNARLMPGFIYIDGEISLRAHMAQAMKGESFNGELVITTMIISETTEESLTEDIKNIGFEKFLENWEALRW